MSDLRVKRFLRAFLSVVLLFAGAGALGAQVTTAPPKRDSAVKLPELGVTVKAPASTRISDTTRITALQRATLPATVTITANRIQETVNVVDAEDALKNLPSVFLRKRNYGDNQAVMETRTWGVSSSARSLVFVDGVPITALIANNNNIGAPRWGLVAPEEIARIDMMYGPYSAAYSGNSIGAVTEITTRLPYRFEGSIGQTFASQSFSLYGTRATYGTLQTSLHLGDRIGRFAFWTSANYQNSHSQPLSYVTSASFPNGTTGGFADQNKLGATANVLGASGLLETGMVNAKLKAVYDLSPTLRAAYTFGFWQNNSTSAVDPFITTTAGQPTYAGQAGFATGVASLLERHTAQSLSLRTNTGSDWDYDIAGTLYRFNTDRQRSPLTASSSGTTVGTSGRVALLDGTGWSTFDAKAIWRRGGLDARNVVSLGVHSDYYRLENPTYNVPDWTVGDSATATGVATEGDGKTRTYAAWVQDAWHISPNVTLTLGGRYEDWRAYDGFNQNGTTKVIQPEVKSSKFSPKGAIAWAPSPEWLATASFAKAYRFATPAELYQLLSTGTTFTSPDPNLQPDNDFSSELRLERRFPDGRAQLALFQDDIHDAIISQFLPLVAGSTTLFSYLSNVDHVRSRGIELSLRVNNVAIHGLELGGSVTHVDAKTLALSGRASATAPEGSAIGKRLPNIPEWRANLMATYRPNDKLAFNLAARYSGDVYTTLDNADINFNTYQGFSAWFVMDARVNYRIDSHFNASLGADNLNNRKYFFFHPFPQRTLVGSVKYGF